MNYCEIKPIRTANLCLRKVRLEDAKDYFDRIGTSEDVTRGMLWEPHTDISQSVASVEKSLRRYGEGRCYRWAITEKGKDALIGIVELLRFDEQDHSCSFAYMLGEDFWGKGYGTEVLRTVFRFAFEEMGVKVIRADHFEDNPASGACMRKAGMTRVGREEGKYIKNGISHHAVLYEIRK